MRPFRVSSAWPLSLALLVLAGGLSGAGQPTRVVWQKDYSRGQTELHRIEVEGDGTTRYLLRLGDGEPVAVDFQLKPHTLQRLWEMFVEADFLNRDKNFVSSRRVADNRDPHHSAGERPANARSGVPAHRRQDLAQDRDLFRSPLRSGEISPSI